MTPDDTSGAPSGRGRRRRSDEPGADATGATDATDADATDADATDADATDADATEPGATDADATDAALPPSDEPSPAPGADGGGAPARPFLVRRHREVVIALAGLLVGTGAVTAFQDPDDGGDGAVIEHFESEPGRPPVEMRRRLRAEVGRLTPPSVPIPGPPEIEEMPVPQILVPDSEGNMVPVPFDELPTPYRGDLPPPEEPEEPDQPEG